MKKHFHSWKKIGYYDAGWGISSSCILSWCKECGAISKSYSLKVTKPKGIK